MTTAWLLGLVLGAQGSLPTTPVTFTNTGQPLHRLIPDLAQAAGAHLSVSEGLRHEVLVVHVEGVPLDRVLKQIAKSTEATWSASGGGWTLVPDNNVRELAYRKRREERLKALRKTVDAYLNPKPRRKEDIEEDAMDRGMSERSAHLIRIVSQLDFGTLADIGEGQRIVFSTQPTRMQRPFSPNMASIQALIAAHNKTATEYNQRPRDLPTEEQMARNPMMRRWMRDQRMTTITEPPAKILLVAERGGEPYSTSVALRLKLYNRTGQLVLADSTALFGEDMDWEDWDEEGEGTEAEPPKKDDSPKLVLTNVSKEFAKISRMGEGMGGGKIEISDSLRAILLRPQEHELLALLVGDYLVQAAKHRKLALVGNLPDSAAELSYYLTEASSVNAFMSEVEDDSDLDVHTAEGMITIAPIDGGACRKARVDRDALGRLLALARGGSIPLVPLAEYAARMPGAKFDEGLSMLPIMVVAPSIMRVAYEHKMWQWLGLYGSLNVSQRQSLDGGSQIPFSALTPTQLGFANRLIYGARPSIMLDEDEPADEGPLAEMFSMMMMGMDEGGDETDFRQEPTEVAPNGLTAGFLHAKVKQDAVFQPLGASNSMLSWMMMMGTASPEELAVYRMMMESAGPEMAEYMPEFKEFRMGSRKLINLRIQLAPAASSRTRLMDENIPADGPTYTFETLPAEIKTRVDKAVEELRKMATQCEAGTFRRRVTPP